MSWETLSEAAALVAALLGVVAVWRRRARATRDFPELRYPERSGEAAEPWRWRIPDAALGLAVEDQPEVSTLHLPWRPVGYELVGQAAGWVVLLVAAGVVAQAGLVRLPRGDLALANLGLGFGAVLALLGWSLLHFGSRVVRIDRRRDGVTLTLRFGLGLHRRVRAGRRGERFEGALQSTLSMDRRRDPAFVLGVVRGRGLFPTARRFFLECNQSQGSWVVAGLEDGQR